MAFDPGAFFGALLDPMNRGLEAQHRREDALKDEKRRLLSGFYTSVLANRESTPEALKYVEGEMAKLYEPEAKKSLSKVTGFVGNLRNMLSRISAQSPLSQPMFQGAPARFFETPESYNEKQMAERQKVLEQADALRAQGNAAGAEAVVRGDEYKRTGHYIPPPRITSLEEKRENLIQSLIDTGMSRTEAEKKASDLTVKAEEKKSEVPKPNLQLVWGQDKDGNLYPVRSNPKVPGENFDANTGERLPDVHIVNVPDRDALLRRWSYGKTGEFYKIGKGRGMSEEQAQAYASKAALEVYGIAQQRASEGLKIDKDLSGISPDDPKLSPEALGFGKEPPKNPSGAGNIAPGPKGKISPPTLAIAQKSTITGLGPKDEENINVYMASLFGNLKITSKAASIRPQEGLKALARATGLDPMALNAELSGDKATATALAEAVKVAGAFGRVQETLKMHGAILADIAKTVDDTGVPLINRPLRWLEQHVSGDQRYQRYVLALNAVQREYARLISGGVQSKAMLPVSTTEKGETTLRADATLGQILTAVDQLHVEADAEQQAFTNQQENLKERLRGGKVGSAISGNKPEVLTWDEKTGTFK